MKESELATGEKYLISTFEDTNRGYNLPRAAKILKHEDKITTMGSKQRTYLTQDTAGNRAWLVAADFIRKLGD